MDSNPFFPADLVALAQRVIDENRAQGRTVAVAESCTGGLVSAALTEIPGSSAVLDRGFVTYSNEAKMEMLDVHADIIDSFGAVSPATAWAMAQGAIRKSRADVAVAISGIAGPDGGTEMKPVGTVVFACAFRGDENVNAEQKLLEGGTRAAIRHQAAIVALELLLPPTP
ncbi:nicotinamide-nucleotide amidohydrolase family protein [Novosphingobium sp. FGD1]|jgi:nicotinamide-nucleotide amidase|uniref:Nicotinamide-nucleotide amidohydrolase family protein n=1 Tax=Novosphingobium silvae TaxID=2692619 RepID=A0A7X4GFZ4_9SPHN|nr:CinA family protein [Novosphingobium silvae]MYL97950.1 nicotinamide-nucleotide amidohydrolase family protein [Novosphingobium silvae]